MRDCLRVVLILLFPAFLPAQNILITFQKPTELFVCGTDTLFVEVLNTGSSLLGDAAFTAALPVGLSYVPNSVTGATEKNTANLAQPVFNLPPTLPGAKARIALLLTADCAAKKAIDAGQVFAANLSVQSSLGSAQVSTSNFAVETGLVFIGFVDNMEAEGERDDLIERTVFFRNNRLGPISSLIFEDAHQAGLAMSVAKAANETTVSPTLYRAEFGADFFSQFGDGDGLLEFGEQAVFTQRVLIEHCGEPSFTNTSKLRLGWGCGNEICQYDSTTASILIKPSTKVPDLAITPIWNPTESHCGDRPAMMGLRIKNKGKAQAADVVFNLAMGEITTTGMKPGSFRLVHQGLTTPIVPNLTTKAQLAACSGLDFLQKASFVVPKVAAQDSVLLLFDVHSCVDSCGQTLPGVLVEFFYKKPCPVGGFVSDTLFIAPDGDYQVTSDLSLKIGACMQSGTVYQFRHEIQSKRLTHSNGFLHLEYHLPYGLQIDASCAIQLGGNQPVSVNSTPGVNQSTVVHYTFQLPISEDSLNFPVCIRYQCDTNMVCLQDTNNIEEVADPLCGPLCFVNLAQKTYWTPEISTPEDCSIGTCAILPLVLGLGETCATGDDGSIEVYPDPSSGPPGAKITWDYKTYRLNLGLPDKNDDRRADSLTPTADTSGLRLDRYLPGDTLRLAYFARVDTGRLDSLYRYIYHEVVRSDIGGGSDNDDFEVKNAQGYFINSERIQYLQSFVEVRYTNGKQIKLPLQEYQGAWSERQYRLGVVNTQPPTILDEVITIRHSTKANFKTLYEKGLLPKLGLEKGDTVLIYTDFVLNVNFTPVSSNKPDPPLIGFRTALTHSFQKYAWNKVPCRKSQYSGFKESRSTNQFSVRPCDNSTLVKPFRYQLRIARENMFPREVRPLAQINNFRQSTPAGLQIASARLQYLVLQDSVSRLKDFALNTSPTNADWTYIAFGPAFADPVDEGFSLSLSTTFLPNCQFDLADTSRQIVLTQYKEGLKPASIQYDTLTNKLGFFSNSPALRFETKDSVVYSAKTDFSLDFSLRNWVVPPAPHLWVAVMSPSGMASDFELLLMPGGQTVPQVNGIYQLNTLHGFSIRNLQLRGRNVNCAPDSLLIVYGWGCTPTADIAQNGCWRDTFRTELRLQNAELEMDVKREPASIKLCETSDYFEIEVYNAKSGFAYDPFATVKLPPGLQIVPGSCQIAYPVGSTFTNIADPETQPGNVFSWRIRELLSPIATSGLPGIDQAPQNAFRIRFRTTAECGFVSNAQPLYGAKAIEPCGRTTNVLNKPGKPLNVFGINPAYGVQLSLAAIGGGTVFCGGTERYEVQMTLLGQPSSGDSAYVLLPSGVTLVTDSYKPFQNAPLGQPTAQPSGFRVALPTNLGSGITMKFQFDAAFSQMAGCDDQTIVVQTRVRSTAFCQTTGLPCTVYISTGEAFLKINPLRPELALGGLSLSLNATGLPSASVNVHNVGATPAAGATVQIWEDKDGDGKLSAPDVLRQTLSNGQTFAPNTSLTLSGSLNMTTDQLCGLLAVLPAAENCACAAQTFLLDDFTLQHAALHFCKKESVQIGVPQRPGATYSWKTTSGVTCPDCPTTTFNPDPTLPIGQPQVLILEETTSNCRTEHRFTVSFGQTASATISNSMVCKGVSVVLNAAGVGATAYSWKGFGIQNPSAQQQTVVPAHSSTYVVTVTFGNSCTATATAAVTVLTSDSLQLPTLTTCPGSPVQVPGQVTEKPGIYSIKYPKSNGCDSVVWQELKVLPKLQTQQQFTVCRGDTLRVFDLTLTETTQICRDFTAKNGCDSTHCVTATFVNLQPKLPTDPDTIFSEAGTLVTLSGPLGYSSYTWSPEPEPICPNCREIEVESDSARLLTYSLRVLDPNGCKGDITYRVLFSPPCDQRKIVMPNAFTPNGDGTNDVFRAVPYEDGGTLTLLTIYDRWGQKIYESEEAAWDGTLQGREAQADVYVWVIEILCGDQRVKKVGDVTLMR